MLLNGTIVFFDPPSLPDAGSPSLREATLYTHLLFGNNNPFYQHLNVKYSILNTQYSKLTPN